MNPLWLLALVGFFFLKKGGSPTTPSPQQYGYGTGGPQDAPAYQGPQGTAAGSRPAWDAPQRQARDERNEVLDAYNRGKYQRETARAPEGGPSVWVKQEDGSTKLVPHSEAPPEAVAAQHAQLISLAEAVVASALATASKPDAMKVEAFKTVYALWKGASRDALFKAPAGPGKKPVYSEAVRSALADVLGTEPPPVAA